MCLRNLDDTIASLFQFRLLLSEGPLRDRLIDEVSSLDSIADVMRSELDSQKSTSQNDFALRHNW
jgi:hypothetical protein